MLTYSYTVYNRNGYSQLLCTELALLSANNKLEVTTMTRRKTAVAYFKFLNPKLCIFPHSVFTVCLPVWPHSKGQLSA